MEEKIQKKEQQKLFILLQRSERDMQYFPTYKHDCIHLSHYKTLAFSSLLIYSKVRNDIPLAGARRNICNENPL